MQVFDEEELWRLMAKYCTQELSKNEFVELHSYLTSRQSCALLFEQCLIVWSLSGEFSSSYYPDEQKGWKKLKSNLETEH